MKAFAYVAQGCEKAAALEIKNKGGPEATCAKSIVTWDVSSYTDICAHAYLTQACKRVGLFLGSFTLTSEQEIDYEAVSALDLSQYITKEHTIAARVLHDDCSRYEKSEIEAEIGAIVIDGTGSKANLSSPDVQVVAIITDNTLTLGIDFCGFDLSKRDYKLFGHRESLNGSIAFAALMYAGYSEEKRLLDPFCGSGTIPIEAAMNNLAMPPFYYKKKKFLFHKIPFVDSIDLEQFTPKTPEESSRVFGYDMLLAALKATQKNAKVAGVTKGISVGRGDIDWMDTKFEKEEVDLIVTHPPQPSIRVEQKKVVQVYKELFYQAAYVLKNDGCLAILSQNTELLLPCAQEHKFEVKEQYTLYQGQMLFTLTLFSKVKP